LSTSSAVGRIAAIVAIAGAVLVLGILLLGGGGGYTITAQFQNASQLVKGNQVLVAGAPAGTVKSISLGPQGQAQVKLAIEDAYAPLRRGTVATVRSTSLSGIANRNISLNLPSAKTAGAQIPDGGTLTQAETVSETDLDELFNTLDKPTVRNIKNVIKGFARAYDGVGKQTNATFRYGNPFFSTSRRVFGELNQDERAFERLIVGAARTSRAVGERKSDVTELVSNLNRMMGAIGQEEDSLRLAVGELPGFMRQFNTTGVNLRAALDDLDPLVEASKPVAPKLKTFFARLRGLSRDAVPTIADLDRTISEPGQGNDLIDLTKLQVPLREIAVGPVSRNGATRPGAFPASTQALVDSLPSLAFLRPYVANEAVSGWFDDFGHSGVADANGGIARIAVVLNQFSPSLPSLGLDLSNPLIPDALLDALQDIEGIDLLERCPGANERDPGDGSTPFTDNGQLDCNPNQNPIG
jgi:phospholipid/cholesterol/gamma-HCH transport system substrate-binding protein